MNQNKITVLAALLLAALLLAGCAAQTPAAEPNETGAAVSEPAPAADAAAADTETDAPAPADTGTADAPAPEDDGEMPADPMALSAEELVIDREGTDGKLPYLTPECKGAAQINEDIEGRFGYLVGEEYAVLEYQAWKGAEGRILSVIVAQHDDSDWTMYKPYCLDLATGDWIGGEELLRILNVDEDELISAELGIMGAEFEYEFGSARDVMGEAFYQELYEKTVSPENAETSRVWLGDLGQLMFVARIYSVAGAEFYEYPMSAGYMFP